MTDESWGFNKIPSNSFIQQTVHYLKYRVTKIQKAGSCHQEVESMFESKAPALSWVHIENTG